jgi:hypothetical protein
MAQWDRLWHGSIRAHVSDPTIYLILVTLACFSVASQLTIITISMLYYPYKEMM